jgi:hypothetical protein
VEYEVGKPPGLGLFGNPQLLGNPKPEPEPEFPLIYITPSSDPLCKITRLSTNKLQKSINVKNKNQRTLVTIIKSM